MAGAEDSSAEDKYIPVRRLGLFIEQSVQNGTRWAASRRNGPALWGRITAAVTAFLHSLFTEGAFPGARPDQSFFVRCDSTTMTQADQDAGIVNIVVGLAPLRPAEFTIISIRQLLHPP